MTDPAPLEVPIDEVSAARLRDTGLELRLVDTADADDFAAWIRADARGFHDSQQSPEQIRRTVEKTAWRRTTGVYDTGLAEPVATSQSWVAELTLPGERTVPAWAISSVTVSPTHRRRGVARAMLEAELRAAASAGFAVAMLTVTESTIYGRYGFGSAADVTDWIIDTRRVRWVGPRPDGSVRFVTPEEARADVAELHDRTRIRRPGDVSVWGLRWDMMTGVEGDDEGARRALRHLRWVDAAGVTRGSAVYRVREDADDFTKHRVDVSHLVADGADAYAGLWRFLLELDLVQEVRAWLLSTDEPLWWMIDDHRAARVTRRDHQWLRILDPVAALEARGYPVAGRLGLEIADDLGLAEGRWLLEAGEDGSARVSPVAELPSGTPALEMPVSALGSLLLGGATASALAAAGRVVELADGSAEAAEALLRSPRTPHLTVWY